MPPVHAVPSADGAEPITFTLGSFWVVLQPPPMTFLPLGQGSVPRTSTPGPMSVDALTVSKPLRPFTPGSPCGPAGPAGPAGPVAPVGPAGPVAPVAPAGPAGP